VPGTNGKKVRPGPNYEEWERARKEERGEEDDL